MVFEVADLDRVKEIAEWYDNSWVFVSLAERYNRLEKLGYELAFRRRRNGVSDENMAIATSAVPGNAGERGDHPGSGR